MLGSEEEEDGLGVEAAAEAALAAAAEVALPLYLGVSTSYWSWTCSLGVSDTFGGVGNKSCAVLGGVSEESIEAERKRLFAGRLSFMLGSIEIETLYI